HVKETLIIGFGEAQLERPSTADRRGDVAGKRCEVVWHASRRTAEKAVIQPASADVECTCHATQDVDPADLSGNHLEIESGPRRPAVRVVDKHIPSQYDARRGSDRERLPQRMAAGAVLIRYGVRRSVGT